MRRNPPKASISPFAHVRVSSNFPKQAPAKQGIIIPIHGLILFLLTFPSNMIIMFDIRLLFDMYSSVSQVSAVLAGLSVQQDHWRDNTSKKLESSSLSVNRTLLTALEAMATMAAREGLWITHSSTSKQIKESILRQATRIRVRTNRADIKIATMELQTLVSDSLKQGYFFFRQTR